MKTEWIWVDLLFDSISHDEFPRNSKERMNEIEDWLQEHFIAGIIDKWIALNYYTYGFLCEEDAMAFRLRWG